MRLKKETPHNTEAQIRQYLRTTLEIIEDEDVPEDLRPIAFQTVANWVGSKAIEFGAEVEVNHLGMQLPNG